jgi:peroxiredoxin
LPRSSLKLTGIFVAVVAVGLAIGWIVGRGDSAVASVGERAPDFTVEMVDGGTFSLSDQRGTPVVLNFWASWCTPCRTEIPDISAFAESHPNVVVIGVSSQDAEQTARAFAEEVGASYPLAIGTEAVEDAYPHFGLPATYIIDEDGEVSRLFNGIVNDQVLADLFEDT